MEGSVHPPCFTSALLNQKCFDHKTALIDIHFSFKPLQNNPHLPQLLLLNISEIYIFKEKKASK